MDDIEKGPALDQNSAMARRLTAKESNPLISIHNALEALRAAPDDVRAQYSEPLIRAQMRAEKMQRG